VEAFAQLGHSGGVSSVAFNPDGKWIVITRDGYYNAFLNGDKYLKVRAGNKVFGIDAYKKTFYRPEVVEDRLAGGRKYFRGF
jgi:hypothetical protein